MIIDQSFCKSVLELWLSRCFSSGIALFPFPLFPSLVLALPDYFLKSLSKSCWLFVFLFLSLVRKESPNGLEWERLPSQTWDKSLAVIFPGEWAFLMEKVLSVFHKNYSSLPLAKVEGGSFSINHESGVVSEGKTHESTGTLCYK